MPNELNTDLIGREWLIQRIGEMVEGVEHLTPVQCNEKFRYLPQGTTPTPGPMSFDQFPFWVEPVNNFDPRSNVRETNICKGVQEGYTVSVLESVLFYVATFIKTAGVMFYTADAELASNRMDVNILPMLVASDMEHIIRSADIGNKRRTGKRKGLLQWDGGGSLIYDGAMNAKKMRSTSVPYLLKDELDGWEREIGKDGNSDKLTDARCEAYWPVRKILRGSTPRLDPSMIWEAFLRGDQRVYNILCRACSYPQVLKHRKPNTETGVAGGFRWELEDGQLLHESVSYGCVDCGHQHYEHDKSYIFALENGAHWFPTARPREPMIRSYHLPAFYSPFGFRPWSKCIADLLEAFDPVKKETLSISKYQTYHNNVLGKPFKHQGGKIRFRAVSRHRRREYKFGEIPNEFAVANSGSKILFLLCLVDVHKRDLAVSIWGITRGLRTYLVDYWRFEDESDVADEDKDCRNLESPVWARLRELIETKVYEADDGSKYVIAMTLIDAGDGQANATVVAFCSEWPAGVYPTLGRQRPTRSNTITEFKEFKTKQGTTGYMVTVDHYKDRLAPVLRREWAPGTDQEQPDYHFNAPVDTTDDQLTELTKEYHKEDKDPRGFKIGAWHRVGGARNELWDLMVLAHAGSEILAYAICIQFFELETIDWTNFWDFAMDPANDGIFGRLA